MIIAPQSTAIVFPMSVVSSTTALPSTGETLVATDVKLFKNGASAWVSKNDATAPSHTINGYFIVTCDATDTGTTGFMKVHIYKAGNLVAEEVLFIMSASAYASFVSGSWAKETTLLAQSATGVLQPQKMATSEITVVRGRINTFVISLGTDWDLTGKDAKLMVKADREDEDNTAIIDRLFTITDAATGALSFSTTVLEVATVGDYWFDITVYDTGTTNNPQTPREGPFHIVPPVRIA